MESIDVNCLVGHWPFRKLYHNTFSDLIKAHSENGIVSGYVSSLNSIFYNDPFEGEEELHEVIKNTGYHHVLTINPTLPAFEEDIIRGIKLFNISGVRIYPSYHGYHLDCPQAKQLCEVLRKYNLPLFLTLRMEDERLSYIYQPIPLSIKEIQFFVETNIDIKMLLLNIRFNEIMTLKNILLDAPNILFDTSGLKDQLFNVEKLVAALGDKKMVYGSLYPLFCLKSTLFEVTKAQISTQSMERILFRNSRQNIV